jgi:hypothetical protein
MSDGNRSKFYYAGLAAAVLAAVIAGALLWRSTTALQASIEHHAAEHAANETHAAYIEIEASCTSVVPAERDECANRIRDAARERRHNISDLEAQQTMAAWTRAMGIAAVIGMSVGFVGIGLVYVTFRETRRAADEATRASNAASSANDFAQKSAERQDRAYLAVEADGINRTKNDRAVGDVVIRNNGQIPARNVKAFVRIKVMKSKDVGKLEWPKKGIESDRTIQPDGEMRRSSTGTIAITNIDDPKAYIFVWGIIEYDDGFGNPRHTRFCHRYPGAWTTRRERPNPVLMKDKMRDFMTVMFESQYADELIPRRFARHHHEYNDAD